jgi:hypothetical protein
MLVLAVFRWEGDPDALLAAYDREVQHAVPREQPHRVIHICARAAGALAAGRVACQQGRAGQVLAVEPPQDHPAGGPGPPRQVALAG